MNARENARNRAVRALAIRVPAPTYDQARAEIERRIVWGRADRGFLALAHGRKRAIPPVE